MKCLPYCKCSLHIYWMNEWTYKQWLPLYTCTGPKRSKHNILSLKKKSTKTKKSKFPVRPRLKPIQLLQNWTGLPRWCHGKEPACQCRRHKRHRLNPWVGKIPWRRKRQPNPVLLSGKSHGQRILVGFSPWGLKESDWTGATQHSSYRSLH